MTINGTFASENCLKCGQARHWASSCPVMGPRGQMGIVRQSQLWVSQIGVHLGRGAVDAGQGEQFACELCHEHHHGRVRGESLGAGLLPDRRPDLQ